MTRLPKDTPVPGADESGPGGRAADRLREFEQARGLTEDEATPSEERAEDEQASTEGTVEDESTGVATPDTDDSAEESAESAAGEEPAPDRSDRPDEGEVAPA